MILKLCKHNKTQDGFTLIELMIAIAIFGILVAGIVNAKISQQNQSITQQQAVEMQQTVRAAMHIMTREIVTAGFNPNIQEYDAGITAGGDGTNDPLTFTSILDNPGSLIPPPSRTVSFILQGPDSNGNSHITMEIDNDGNPVMLAQNIQNLAFSYFDRDGNIIAAPVPEESLENIRSIRIDITAGIDVKELARAAGNSTRSLTATVSLRNI